MFINSEQDKPDTAIINIGSNNFRGQNSHEIYKDIIKVVDIFHAHGVNDVYVSAIPLRIGNEQVVTDNYLRAKSFVDDLDR